MYTEKLKKKFIHIHICLKAFIRVSTRLFFWLYFYVYEIDVLTTILNINYKT